jgi:acyl-CoA thioesterase
LIEPAIALRCARFTLRCSMTDDLFDLRATHNPHRWYLPITENVCVGPKGGAFMFGGVGLAASVKALEQTSGRPLIWATAQYLSYARPPQIVDLDVWIPVTGKQTTQARVIAHVGDQEIVTVLAALGSRPSIVEGQWPQAPAVPPPAECAPVFPPADEVLGVQERLDVRLAYGRYRSSQIEGGPSEDGRLTLWMRPQRPQPYDAATFAVLADYLPGAISNATGVRLHANSLDNTLRIARLEATEWVLCDMQIQATHSGFAHGMMRMFSEGGALMAMGSQSMIMRAIKGREGST